jgi:dipeptidyl aminopeptidase/acylaminoacyl peptidase
MGLIAHQLKNDWAVPFSQGVEFFLALQRLRKNVWMLQYDREGHVILNKEARVQHAIRITQFFDHYLKGEPEPEWMRSGIPARCK